MRHLPECRAVPIRPEMERWVEEHPEDFGTQMILDSMEGPGISFMRCADDCPALAESIRLGRELAERYGW